MIAVKDIIELTNNHETPDCAYILLNGTSVRIYNQLSGFDLKRSNNELKIRIPEDEVQTLKSQINKLATLYTDLSDTFDEITNNKHVANEAVEQIVAQQSKFQCNMCECTLKTGNHFNKTPKHKA